ncbi:MAG: helix-turn-helix domain-containing protein, partial [Enterocloster sp.]
MGYFRKLYQSGLPHRAISVYMYLKDRTDKNGTCYPSISTISKELVLSRNT